MENQNSNQNQKSKRAANQEKPSAQERNGSEQGQAQTSAQTTAPTGEDSKSVGTVIAQSLARESQESIDKILSQINGYFNDTTDYVSENPREAALIAVTAGMAAYVLLATKPGRKLFDAGAERFVPEIARWISANFSGVKH